MTGGLWEVIGIPAETLADGTEVQVVVSYDNLENVHAVQVIKGQKVLEERRGLFARRQSPSPSQTLNWSPAAAKSKAANSPLRPRCGLFRQCCGHVLEDVAPIADAAVCGTAARWDTRG